MRSFRYISILALIMSLFITAAWADEYADTKKMFEDASESNLFETAYGYALFPTIGKAGLVVGGAFGKGRVYEKGTHLGDTSMAQASIGFQIGGTGFSQVIFFEDKRALDTFTSGNFEFGAEAQATVITAAVGGNVKSTGSSSSVSGGKNNATVQGVGYNKGMAIFTIIKGGLMYEISIGGQKFKYMKL